MTQSIVPIVEGHSEVESVGVLLRRLLRTFNRLDIQIARPFRVKRYQVVKEGQIERAVTQGTRGRENVGAVLVLLDADDDCPAWLAKKLLARCAKVTGLPVAVVLANREFEAWFLGAKESLRGIRGIRQDAVSPANPESIRDAKGRISANMSAGRRYLEVDDQPALAEKLDIKTARKRCPSFDKLVREIQRLAQLLRE
jgi:hypothetical protein